MQFVGVSLAEPMKFGALDTSLHGNCLELVQEVPVGFAVSVWKNQVLRLGVPVSYSLFHFPNQLCRNRNESVLRRFLLALALEPELSPRLGLNVQRALLPVEVCVFRVAKQGCEIQKFGSICNIVSGLFTPVLAKLSKSFSLIDCISGGESFVEGKLEAPKHPARMVQDLYFEPMY